MLFLEIYCDKLGLTFRDEVASTASNNLNPFQLSSYLKIDKRICLFIIFVLV